MHNLSTIITFEFLRTVKRPSFWISILSVPIIFGAIFALSYFSGQSTQQIQERQEEERFTVQVLDESGYLEDEQLTALEAQRTDNKESGITAVEAGEVDAFFYYPSQPTEEQIEVYNKDDGIFENFKYTTVANSLLTAGAEAQVGSSEVLQVIKGEGVETDQTTYSDGVVVNSIEQVVLPAIFIVVFFFVIIFLSGQMLTSTTEEKENRVIEMVLTTIRPRALILGKIIAILALGLVQASVLLLPVIIGYVFFRDMVTLPNIDTNAIFEADPMRVLFAILYLVFSVLLFTGLLVGISAAVPTAKDANNFLGFTMFAMFIPFYAIMSILTDASQPIVQVFTYFPLTAPTTLLIRNAVGNLTELEAIIGLVVLVLSSIIAITIAGRIFRTGTLQYSRILSLREIFKK